jgi:drug/metabolite transporter (DMT)-like permease
LTAARRATNPRAGVAFAVLAVACFATLDTATKVVSTSVAVAMAVWFRYAFQAVATAAVVLPRKGRAALYTAHPRFQVLRGVLLLTTTVFAFFSLKYMPVGEFTAIVMIVPLVVTVAAATMLGERVSPLRWLLVAGGFVGAMVIIRPGGTGFSWALLLPLGLVVTNSWFQVLTSRLARTEDPMTTHLYTGWVGMLASSIALPFVWTTPASLGVWLGLFLMGLMGTVGHFLLILAFTNAPAGNVTPFLYFQIAFATIAGWIVYSHIPDDLALAGMVLIAVCGAIGGWLTLRESRVVALPAEG